MKKLILFFTTAAFLFLSSCTKEDELRIAENHHTQIELRTAIPSLFGNNKIVPIQVARSIAERIDMTIHESLTERTIKSKRIVDSLYSITDSLGTPVLYIANYLDDGFSVISADERALPICAFVKHGKYQKEEVPSMLLDWFDLTFENIQLVRSKNVTSINVVKECVRILKDIDMEKYLIIDDDCCPQCPNYPECTFDPFLGCGSNVDCDSNEDPCWPYNTTTVGPLMTTAWNQGCTYNEQCPNMNCNVCFSNDNAWTGCVATAMAQILRYWSHPCSQNYNYSTMPNNSGNSEVQRMMRDIGNAVDMDYGCDGSGADGDKTDNAFKNDFCFGSADRDSYSSGSYQIVVQDIDAGRPVLLDGCRTRKRKFPWLWYTYSNCHMWVCDGYERNQNRCYSTLKFHMNWGWGGFFNGWYSFGSWSPGTSNYQYAQDFTHNIHP